MSTSVAAAAHSIVHIHDTKCVTQIRRHAGCCVSRLSWNNVIFGLTLDQIRVKWPTTRLIYTTVPRKIELPIGGHVRQCHTYGA